MVFLFGGVRTWGYVGSDAVQGYVHCCDGVIVYTSAHMGVGGTVY